MEGPGRLFAGRRDALQQPLHHRSRARVRGGVGLTRRHMRSLEEEGV